jgi:amino acid adenylation domain-containing protein
LTGALRKQIAEHKDGVLEYLRQAAPTLSAAAPIPRAATDALAPLSFAQERLWFLQQVDAKSTLFNLCRAVKISGPLDVSALESSLNDIVRRHEALRTKFFSKAGLPMQRTARFTPLSLALADLSELSESQRQKKSHRLIRAMAQRRFDLTGGRLLRVQLLRHSAQLHLLVFCTHHMVADAWSMGVFASELWTLYQARVRGASCSLPPLAIQYRDYASWQRQNLPGADVDGELAYWRKQLADAPLLDLPCDFPRPARLSSRGARQPIALSQPLTAALNALSRRANVTPFMTLLAAFQVLLQRYTGQDDILVGSPVANRERREFETLIGFFVNTLVLRSDFSGAPSFTGLLRRVRETCLDAQEHQTLPFEKIVEALNPQRELNRHPLFQAMLVWQNTPRRPVVPAGLELEPMEVDSETSQFDLSLCLRERDGKLIGYFEYASDLFAPATMARMAGHFATLLQGIVADAEQPVAKLPLLTPAERQQLLFEWNRTGADFPAVDCMHQLFEAQTERTPNAIAVEYGENRLTYGELNRRANRLADRLRRLGVGPEKLVGILIDRSLEMVIGLLGILKAGGAYVPLDPDYPEARLAFMLDDARVSLVLTKKSFSGAACLANVSALCLDDEALGADHSEKNFASGVTSLNAAYVIYTSGSTGMPKGVVGLHRGAVNRFAWMWRRYPFAAREVCCAKTSLSFVDSVWEIFGPLLQGVGLVVVPDDVAREPRALSAFLAARRVTRIVLVPSLLQAFLDETPDLGKALPRLRLWSCSGEELTGALAARFRKSHPRALLLNLYGSSEVAADVTCCEVGGPAAARVPIGRPIANTRIFILDSHAQPVPLGVSGEIYVGGDGLARGYWQRPGLSAEKFVANPFDAEGDSLLYRTGDLARYLADGNIEYLCRADRQIKIRGQRLELGEIEAALQAHPGVRACAVGAHDRSLIAYVVAAAPFSSTELRAFLKNKLPGFMIPAVFIALDDLPLLPNGKVNKRALPSPVDARLPAAKNFTLPQTKIEKRVAAIWRELLQLERIGVDDDFFALGGHSLLAVQMVARLRAAFDEEISLRDLFAAPTIAAVAKKISAPAPDNDGEALPAIAPLKLTGKLPLSLAQKQFLTLDELVSGAEFLHLPYAFQLNGRLDTAALRRSLQTIVDRHAVLRTGFAQSDGLPIQIIRRKRKVACRLRDLSSLPPLERRRTLQRLSREDADAPFDLEAGPPCRFKLIRLAKRQHVLLVTAHHIIADQGSMRLLRGELTQLYGAFARGRPSQLFELPFQFVDFTRWQKRLLESGGLGWQFDYWKKILAGAAPKLVFPNQPKRLGAASFRAARKRFDIDDGLFAQVRQLARRQKTTPFIVLLAALDAWLFRMTGCRDLRVATLVANRGRPGTESMIGYFVNAVVLRARLAPPMSFAQLLDQARAAAFGAFAHQDLPIEELARAMKRNKNSAPKPLYSVMLNYRRFGNHRETVAGLTIASSSDQDRAADPEMALTSADLSFDFRELSTKLTASVNFKVHRFDEPTLDRMLKAFSSVLSQCVARPERQLSSIKIPALS